jgi:ATP-binding cassette subfamily C protein
LKDSRFAAYVATLLRVMRWRVGSVLLLMISVSLTEGVGLLLLVPLLQLVGVDVQQGTVGRLAEASSAAFTAVGLRPTLVSVLGVYVVIVSARALFLRWQTTAISAFQNEFIAHLRQRLYRSIANATWVFFSRRRSSDFVHALTAELSRVESATYYLLAVIANSIIASVYLLLALQLSAAMTGLVLACGAALSLALRGPAQAARVSGERLSSASNELYAVVGEHLAGMKATKSYAAEERHADILSHLTERLKHVYVETSRNHADAKSWFDIGSVLILSGIIYASFEVLGIPTAAVLLLLFLFFRIMPRLSGIQQNYQSFVNFLPAFTRIRQLEAQCEAAAEPKPDRFEAIELRRAIQFEDVCFSYETERDAAVIQDINLIIRAEETTAIVGPSGAGKSTIADLVIGLIVPQRGRVLVDGLPLTPERIRSWRNRIGYVAQDTFLFHDTVRANLLWASPNTREEDVLQALRLAVAEEFVARLPDGLETVVGDRGVRLSGGERQRLALARALLRKPSLLILDEATSSLDSESERRIQGAIEQLHGRMTILVIAHRLSTIREADVIHVVEQGRLVESGSWDELVANVDGRFRALCRAQGVDRDMEKDLPAPVRQQID